MATLVSKPNWGRLILAGLVAGIAGGILVDIFELLAMHASLLSLWQRIASAGFDAQAAQSPTTFLWIGVLLYAIISIGWAIGYAYAAATSPRVASIAWLSGLVFGAVVWLVMTIVFMLDQMHPQLDAASITLGVIGYCVFYGLPVALIVRAQASRV